MEVANKQLQEFDKQVKLSATSLLGLINEAEKFEKTLRSVDSLKEYVKVQKQSQTLQEKLKKNYDELVDAQLLQQKAQLDLNKSNSDAFKISEKTRIQANERKKQIREEAKQELGLANSIDKKNEQLKKSNEPYRLLTDKLNQTRNEAKNLQAQLLLLEQQGKKNSIEYQNLANKSTILNKQTIALDNSVKKIDSSLGLNQRNVGNYISGLAGLGKQLIGAFGIIGGVALFANTIKGSAKNVIEFESAQSELSAILGVNKKEMKDLTSLTLELGATTSFTAIQTTKASTELAKLGFTSEEIQKSLKGVLDGAVAMRTSIEDSASLSAKTLRAFGLDASQTERVVSTLAVSTTKTGLSFDYLNDALPYASTGAKQLGFSVEKTTALLGILADNGIKASQAGTSLRDIFSDLSVKGITFDQAMEKINNSTNKNKKSFEIFGKTSANAGVILAENVGKVNLLTTAFTNQSDALKELVETRLDNLEGDLTILNSTWEGFILSLEKGDGAIAETSRGFIQMTTSILELLTIQEKETDKVRAEQLELNLLISRITSINTSNKERLSLLLDLQKNYPGFLGNLNIEKVTNQELTEVLGEVNQAYYQKLVYTELEAKSKKEQQKLSDITTEKLQKETELYEFLFVATDKLRQAGVKEDLIPLPDVNNLEDSSKKIQDLLLKNKKSLGSIDTSGLQAYFDKITQIRGEIEPLKTDFKLQTKEVNTQNNKLNIQRQLFERSLNIIGALKSEQGNVTSEISKTSEQLKQLRKDYLNSWKEAKKLNTETFNVGGRDYSTKTGRYIDELTKKYKEAQKEAYKLGKATFNFQDNSYDTKTGKKIIKSNTNSEEELDEIKKQNEERKRLAEEKRKNEIENQKTSIEAQKLALDYKIKSFKDEENTYKDNIAFLEVVKNEKLRILNLEYQNELKTASSKADINKINKKYTLDKLQIDLDYKKDFADLKQKEREQNVENIDLELRLYKIKNESKLENAQTISKALIDVEKKRIDAIYEYEKKKLRESYNLNEQQANDIISNNANIGTETYKNAVEFLEKSKELYKTNTDSKKELDDNYYQFKTDARTKELEKAQEQNQLDYQYQEKILDEKRLLKLEALQKEYADRLDVDAENLPLALEQDLEIKNEYQQKENEINEENENYKLELKKRVEEQKRELLNRGLNTLIDIVGRESSIGKALATFQTGLNTYQAVSNALKYGVAPFKYIDAGITLAQGLAQISKINSTPKPKYEKGTLFAPNTELATTDEKGAELHFDKNWKLKDKGTNTGARTKLVEKGDKILPADLSKFITQPYINENKKKEVSDFNYKLIGKEIAKHINKGTHFVSHNGEIVKIKSSGDNSIIYKTDNRKPQIKL